MTTSSPQLGDPGSGTPASGKVSFWVEKAFVPILVAAVAFAGTFWGAKQATNSTQAAQLEQFKETRANADRAKRSEVYLAYIESAAKYYKEVDSKAEECSLNPSGRANNWSICFAVAQTQVEKTESGRSYIKSYTDVYVFGSDAAADSAGDLATNALFDTKVPGRLPERPTVDTGAEAGKNFFHYLGKFQQVACREIPATGRAKC